MKFERSLKYLESAKKLIPTASQTYSKSYKYFCEGVSPVFLSHGKGGYVWDIDGNKFIDFICGLGAITIGYCDERIDNEIKKQLDSGIIFSQPTLLEVRLAKKLVDLIPCAEMVKFFKNGSDSTFAAIKLARAFTNKYMIFCCGYHGMHDWYIGSHPESLGIPDPIKRLTKQFKYNDIESLKKLFKEHKDNVAAVIMEPMKTNEPNKGFLEEVKKLTHENGALLIFDEVYSGFRMGIMAHKLLKVNPDMVTLGKGMANGMPISAVVGSKEVMSQIDKGVFLSTTFGGEALSLASALATIEILEKPESYEHLYNLGKLWIDEVKGLINEYDLNEVIEVYGNPYYNGLIFHDKGKLFKEDLFSVYQQRLIQEGILNLGNNNFCLHHTREDVKKFVKAVKSAFFDIRLVIRENSVDSILKGKKYRPIFKRR